MAKKQKYHLTSAYELEQNGIEAQLVETLRRWTRASTSKKHLAGELAWDRLRYYAGSLAKGGEARQKFIEHAELSAEDLADFEAVARVFRKVQRQEARYIERQERRAREQGEVVVKVDNG